MPGADVVIAKGALEVCGEAGAAESAGFAATENAQLARATGGLAGDVAARGTAVGDIWGLHERVPRAGEG